MAYGLNVSSCYPLWMCSIGLGGFSTWGGVQASRPSACARRSRLQGAPPCLEKMCILRAKCAKFQALFWSKFTEMYDFLWSQGEP